MQARLASLLLIVLVVPAAPQEPGAARQINQRIEMKEQRLNQIENDRTQAHPALVRLQLVHQDAQELFTLSAAVQSDLQQLGRGMLTKDLGAKLKKMEKLSKRLRQEMNP
ncbi:MAG TPA: hypothetical protein VGM18_19665 [Candidatus Sulfotelmatobacter sp.]|jgi:hypothetical protein